MAPPMKDRVPETRRVGMKIEYSAEVLPRRKATAPVTGGKHRKPVVLNEQCKVPPSTMTQGTYFARVLALGRRTAGAKAFAAAKEALGFMRSGAAGGKRWKICGWSFLWNHSPTPSVCLWR